MPSYESYINAAGASTAVVDPNTDWSGYYKRNDVPAEKVYAEGKAVNTYANAAPVVVRMPSREAAYNKHAQNMILSSQNRIMEQQRQWNEAWAKRVAEMEQEEEPPVMDIAPVLPDDIPVLEQLNEEAVCMEDAVVEVNDIKDVEPENVESIEEPEFDDNFRANYPHEEIEDGLFGAPAEMSDEEFLANVEYSENENIEEYGEPAEEITEESDDIVSFNETQSFNNNEQDDFIETGVVTFDDDDDVISFDEPATVESVEVLFDNSPVVDEDEEDVVPEPVVVKEMKKRGRPAGKTVSATKKKTTTKKTTTKKK